MPERSLAFGLRHVAEGESTAGSTAAHVLTKPAGQDAESAASSVCRLSGDPSPHQAPIPARPQSEVSGLASKDPE